MKTPGKRQNITDPPHPPLPQPASPILPDLPDEDTWKKNIRGGIFLAETDVSVYVPSLPKHIRDQVESGKISIKDLIIDIKKEQQ